MSTKTIKTKRFKKKQKPTITKKIGLIISPTTKHGNQKQKHEVCTT
jgi:hypothetical protein